MHIWGIIKRHRETNRGEIFDGEELRRSYVITFREILVDTGCKSSGLEPVTDRKQPTRFKFSEQIIKQ